MSTQNMIPFRSSQNTPPDTGEALGRHLYDNQLAARQRYAEPYVPEQGDTLKDATGRNGEKGAAGFPYYFNKYEAPPVKYSVPTAKKERHVARQAIREAANKENIVRPDPITEDEVDMLQNAQKQVETARFEAWFNRKYDPHAPGALPQTYALDMGEFVERRVDQAATDYEFALRKEMIDTWGPQSRADLELMYMLDQGIIEGPTLVRKRKPSAYDAGVLSPYNWTAKRGNKLRLPGASNPVRGAIKDGDYTEGRESALEANSGLAQLAGNMYKVGIKGTSDDPGLPGSLASYPTSYPRYQ